MLVLTPVFMFDPIFIINEIQVAKHQQKLLGFKAWLFSQGLSYELIAGRGLLSGWKP